MKTKQTKRKNNGVIYPETCGKGFDDFLLRVKTEATGNNLLAHLSTHSFVSSFLSLTLTSWCVECTTDSGVKDIASLFTRSHCAELETSLETVYVDDSGYYRGKYSVPSKLEAMFSV